MFEFSFYIFVLSFLIFTINAQNLPGNWPPVDKPPPPVNEWTSLVDQSKLPNAPVVGKVGDCPATDTFCNWSCTECARTDTTDIIQCPTQKVWGLSFDDGPTQYTTPLLDYLQSQNIILTFFAVGSRVYENPQILKRAADAGHQIGVHTWSHTPLTTQTNEEIIAEIKWTEAAIQQAIGLTPKYMRPPYGDVDDRVRGILAQLGYKAVIWDRDTNDWMSANDKTFQMGWVEGNFTEWVKEDDPTGHISLEHDLYAQTAAEGPKVIPILQGAGYTIQTVAKCVGDLQPYHESTSITTNTTTTTANTTNTTNTTTNTTTNPTTETTPTASQILPNVNNSSPTDSPTNDSTDNTSSVSSNAINDNSFLLLVLSILGTFMII